MKKQYEELMSAAKSAAKNAYAPYSRFQVGSAVLTKAGKIFIGANVENASFSLTNCAERAALQNAVSNGAKNITAIAVWTKSGGVFPCGACRQVILELAPNADILINNKTGDSKIFKPSKLLASGFSKEDLKK